MSSTVRVAVTQHEPVWLDLEATVTKTCKIIQEAAEGGAKLVAFPECWIPGYPAWIWTRNIDFDLGVQYVQNCLVIDSPQMQRIQEAAANNAINVSLGFSERAKGSDSVYIAQALIGSDGQIKVQRRKLKPTHMERSIFGDASGECLAKVVPLPDRADVKVGQLSCWEHIQPLLKYFTLSQNPNVHVAAWPPLDTFVEGSPGFYSMTSDGCLTLSQTYAVEAQSYVLHAVTAFGEDGVEKFSTKGAPLMGSKQHGTSAVIGPDGRILVKPDSPEEQLIFADLDLNVVTKTRTFADAGGHYSRPDLLWLGADPSIKPVVRIISPSI